jgi:Cyclin M transmembrane N-terminal domain
MKIKPAKALCMCYGRRDRGHSSPVFVNGLFALAEIAVVSGRKARLKRLADAGDDCGCAALEIAKSPGHFLSTVHVGITLINSAVTSGQVATGIIAPDARRRFPYFLRPLTKREIPHSGGGGGIEDIDHALVFGFGVGTNDDRILVTKFVYRVL